MSGPDEEPAPDAAAPVVDTVVVVDEPAPPVTTMIEADVCDDATHAGETWMSASSAHLTAYFFSDTPADHDRADILAQRETAYEAIRSALGVTDAPAISVHLSPSRLAATANGKGAGTAWPGQNRLEVLYTGASDSYENTRFGHELTHVIEPYIDPANPRRHPFLVEGLAEYLDQSGRDMHAAYAQQLLSGNETRVRLATFENRDATARNYGRAGSFVQLLVERYGMPKFLDIFRGTAVTWAGGCWTHAQYGCVSTADALTTMLDGVVKAKTGDRWSDLQPVWEAKVRDALMTADIALPAADIAEIENLVRVGDLAIARGDTTMYRTTLDGFYCDANAETLRADVSRRAVAAMTGNTSKIEAIRATGIKNFRTAQVFVRRTDARGLSTFSTLSVEHFPVGWRVTWGPDWF